MGSKLKREECRQTKHDSAFSIWKVLIGPYDWLDYHLGKDGVTRYRIHNLPPSCSCPGLYELGVAVTRTDGGIKTRQHDVDNIVVVYLGQADNVRTRLQEYGRAGSHLDHGKSLTVSSTVESPSHPRGPNLFKDVFSKGYSIVYRWSPMKDKVEAEKMETRLLQLFDYAWNRRLNGPSRHEEILHKLENAPTRSPLVILRMLKRLKQPLFAKKPGIKLEENFPRDDEKSGNKIPLLPQILKLVKSRPQLVRNDDWLDNDHAICGVAVGSGRICRNKPIVGRKRCLEHKGRRITGLNHVRRIAKIATEEDDSTYSGSPCMYPGTASTGAEQKLQNDYQLSSDGNLLPKTKVAICKSEPNDRTCRNNSEYETCGVILADGLTCMEKPVLGRKRCLQHKGQRVTCSQTAVKVSSIESAKPVCGVHLDNGSVCMNLPISGRKRCASHKGRRVG